MQHNLESTNVDVLYPCGKLSLQITLHNVYLFNVSQAIVIAAASLLFLIRDSDRYQKPPQT